MPERVFRARQGFEPVFLPYNPTSSSCYTTLAMDAYVIYTGGWLLQVSPVPCQTKHIQTIVTFFETNGKNLC